MYLTTKKHFQKLNATYNQLSHVPFFTRSLHVYSNFHDRVSTNTCTVYLVCGISVDRQKTPLGRVTHKCETPTDTIKLV